MARKEINIFGTSFLDLLSGALAAVIILFIIVPKMTQENIDAIEKVKKIEAVVESIDVALEEIKTRVPKEEYELIKGELDELKNKVDLLNKEIENLKQDIIKITQENTQLKESLEKRNREIERLQAELERLEERLKQEEAKNTAINNVEQTLGVFAKFGIIASWDELDTDVDMGVQCFSPQEQVWRMYPNKKWGILGQDVRERIDDGEQHFELFYVPEINSGVYTAWVNIYEGSRGQNAHMKCILIFHPGKPDEQREEIPAFNLSQGRHKCFVTFRLTDNGFEILSHREPIWGNGRVIK